MITVSLCELEWADYHPPSREIHPYGMLEISTNVICMILYAAAPSSRKVKGYVITSYRKCGHMTPPLFHIIFVFVELIFVKDLHTTLWWLQ